MSKVRDKFQRIYRNQSKESRLALLLDYEAIASDPKDRMGIHLRKEGWSQSDIEEMVSLIRESLR